MNSPNLIRRITFWLTPKGASLEKYDRSRHNTEEVKNLVMMAIGFPTPEGLQKLLDLVYDIEGHFLFLTRHKDKIIGVIGIDITAPPHGWILHLAVHPDYRKQGIGKYLISQVMVKYALQSVALETDQDAVGFYRACGFSAVEIKSNWPGVHRYRCTKGQRPKSVLEYYDNRTLPE
jgi:ribosomal protein S18 acetylase RimI-like enzyme